MSTTHAKLIEALRVITDALESGVVYAPEELSRWLEKEAIFKEMSQFYITLSRSLERIFAFRTWRAANVQSSSNSQKSRILRKI
ncbi:hypothetical protein QR680_011602 [Steinernema hermaphroditum]|uniref:Uncharacterized protein n=1 Tax=Steinernema hermaphroditum TaxID=289476 RepID=A0AA39I0L1_9BILA|nr:hypothetical protein QR680_011602 [Steinernema hermaphroditum]